MNKDYTYNMMHEHDFKHNAFKLSWRVQKNKNSWHTQDFELTQLTGSEKFTIEMNDGWTIIIKLFTLIFNIYY